MTQKYCLIVGAGLTGASAAAKLIAEGWKVDVVEALDEPGGNCRTGTIGGLTYEKCGPHIFHTNDDEVAHFVRPWCRQYHHVVQSYTSHGLLHWPPQISELKNLDDWPDIEKSLAGRPGKLPDPDKSTFEEYAVALMGYPLYKIFVETYTTKQWGCHPSDLSACFAPKRIDIRDDGYLGLFRDKYQGWLDAMPLIHDLLTGASVSLGEHATADNVPRSVPIIVTAALDDFLDGQRTMAWRGSTFRHEYIPDKDWHQDAGVVNLPQPDYTAIRTTETKHMTGEKRSGTVVSWEYSQAPDVRAYPVYDTKMRNKNIQYNAEQCLAQRLPMAIPAGRLARYVYIDMWQAIRMGWHAADKIIKMSE